MINFKNPCLDTLYKTEKTENPTNKNSKKKKISRAEEKKQNKTRLSSTELDSHLTPL